MDARKAPQYRRADYRNGGVSPYAWEDELNETRDERKRSRNSEESRHGLPLGLILYHAGRTNGSTLPDTGGSSRRMYPRQRSRGTAA